MGHRLVSALPTAFVTVFHDLSGAITTPFKNAIVLYRERELQGPAEAAGVSVLSFLFAILEFPIIILASVLFWVGVCLGEALDFFTCGICFGWGTLFNVPDNLNNILLTTSGKQCLYKKQLGQAAGATAAAWPI